MYQVFDNNKPAQQPYHSIDKSWSNSKFSTLEEAQEYAKHWLGMYSPDQYLSLNEKYDLYGSIIEIREVE